MMKALQEVVGKAGANMSEASRQAILGLIDDDTSDQTGKITMNNSFAWWFTDIPRFRFYYQRSSSRCAREGSPCHELGSSYQVCIYIFMV
jgi:hypothetical protein